METTPQAQLAVLIDADNANAKRIDGLLAEVAKYGRATTKRAYGDWTNTHLGSWKQTLARHAIQPMQQFSNTRGKNSTDSALIIDAMDLLYTERFDGFCIVSSDSDFTRLASRIREAGLTVYGFGERKTPQPFVRACDRFIYVEVLGQTEGEDEPAAETVAAPPTGERRTIQNGRRPQPAPAAQPAAAAAAARPAAPVADKPADAGNGGQGAGDRRPAAPRGTPLDDPALLNPLRAAVADACDDDGWAELGAVGSLLSKRMPEFDPRNYGRKKLSDLFAAIAIFEVNERAETGRSRTLFVREKRDRNGGDTGISARPDVAAAGDAATVAATAVEPKAESASPPARPSAPQTAPRPPQPPRPSQSGKPQQGPRPALQGLPAEPTDEELKALAGAGWAPRRDDRRPTWAVTPVPILPAASAEPSPAAAPVAASPAEPVAAAPASVIPVAAPVVQPIADVIADAPAAAPAPAATEAAPRKAAARKSAAKKTAANKPVSKASAEAAIKVVTKAATKAASKAAASKAAPDAAEAPKRRSRSSKPAAAD